MYACMIFVIALQRSAAGSGMSLPMIGALLGHSQPQTTARYAHLAADPVRAANEAIGGTVNASLKGEDGK